MKNGGVNFKIPNEFVWKNENADILNFSPNNSSVK